MQSLYEFLKASKGLPVSDSYAALWGKSAAESGIKTITGVLPLTFTAKGGTAGDWVIEGNTQGVGERTKNKFEITATTQEINRITFSVDKQAGTITTNGTASGYAFIDMVVDIPQGTYIFTTNTNGTGHTNVILRKNNAGKTYIVTLSSTDYSYTVDRDGIIIRVAVAGGVSVSNEINAPMIRPAGTSAEFIPYGYQIPLTVSQQGQPDKTVDIYIGDSPLTEGETVSKTSTGQDIELFNGENTVSTMLYNKPDMEIKYAVKT